MKIKELMVFRKILSMVVLAGLFTGWLAGCVGVDPEGRGYSVAVPMAMINSTLAKQFPLKEERSLGTLSISDPNVLGQQGSNKLGVGTAFKFTNFLIPNGIGGNLQLSSGVRYDSNTKNLYLADPMVEELKFQDFSLSQYLTEDMKRSIGLIIAEVMAQKPIYNIQQKAGMGAGFVKGIDVRDGQVFLTFGL